MNNTRDALYDRLQDCIKDYAENGATIQEVQERILVALAKRRGLARHPYTSGLRPGNGETAFAGIMAEASPGA